MPIFDTAEFNRIKAKYWDPKDPTSKLFYKDPSQCVRFQFGIVADNKHPGRLGWLKVAFPIWGDNFVSDWVPLVRPYSGKNMGIWALPEIGENVLCVFINDNPSKPVVLGSFYSPTSMPPFQDYKDNNIKGFTSRSGLKIILDDTEGEEKIVISAKEDKMRMVLDKNMGLSIVNELGDIEIQCRTLIMEAGEDVNITMENKLEIVAQDDIEIVSRNNIKVKSAKDIIIQGSTISMNANSITAEGKPIACREDQVLGIDTHIEMVPSCPAVLFQHPSPIPM